MKLFEEILKLKYYVFERKWNIYRMLKFFLVKKNFDLFMYRIFGMFYFIIIFVFLWCCDFIWVSEGKLK